MKLVYLALLVACLCGCSPSEEAAEDTLRQQVDSQSQGNIKLMSFSKTDGQNANVHGIDVRQIDFTAEIEFEQNGTWLCGGGSGHLAYSFTTEIHRPQNTLDALMDSFDRPVIVNAQGRAQIRGRMIGTKNDSGWKFQTSASSLVTPVASR